MQEIKDRCPFLTQLFRNPGLQSELSCERGSRWWSRFLLWYNSQNMRTALFPKGSKNTTAGNSFFAFGFKCFSCLCTPQILFASYAAGLVYSLAPLIFLLDFSGLLSIWGSYNLLPSSFQWTLFPNTVFNFQLGTIFLIWTEVSSRVFFGFSQRSPIERSCYLSV